mmetsp:Transcript_26562/g.35472  ORF Transcript_26562/g.35472 Transcript_26562/m.35472 type:complete len:611 (+) Transcript_26562:146-1978(+)
MDSKKEGQGAHCAKISSYCPDGAGEKEIATKMTLQPPVRGYATYKREASFDSVDEPPSWDEDGETVRTIDTMPVHYRASWDTTNEPPAWDDNGDTIRSIQSEYAFGEPNVVPASVGVGTPLVLATLVEHEEARGIDAVASKSVRDFHEGSYDRIEISIKCRDLKNRDLISKSDPFCVVHLDEEEDQYNNSEDSDDDDGISSLRLSKKPSERSKKIGTTEVIKDNLNPDFTTTFVTNFIFEERQTLIVRVYDEDVKGDPDLSKHDYLGAAAVTLGKLMSSRGHIVKLPILGKGEKKLRGRGHMIIQAEKVASCNDQLIMTLAGSDLVKVGSKLRRSFGGKSDPFVVVSRKNPSGEYMSVWRSEVCYSTLHPTWSCRLPLQRVCNADLDRPILFEIFDWEKSGSHKDMGKVQTTVRRILDLPSFNIKHTKCNDSSAGTLKIQRAEIWKIPSMLEYTSGSCEINFMAAVDFSASNNFVKRFHRSESSGSNFLQQRYKLSSESLHFFSEVGFPNEYQAALSSIGSILSDYGCHRSAPLYAFGAKIDGHSDSIFVVPEIDANEGDHNMRRMLTSYKSAFRSVITAIVDLVSIRIIPLDFIYPILLLYGIYVFLSW